MPYRYDATGIEMNNYELLPEGWFPFRILEVQEGKSKKGYYQVLAKCKCLDERYDRVGLVWNFLTFMPKDSKGAGIPVHFLKCIGEPCEGEFTITPDNWIGKKFMGYAVSETYEGKTNNKLAKISPFSDVPAAVRDGVKDNTPPVEEEGSIPF